MSQEQWRLLNKGEVVLQGDECLYKDRWGAADSSVGNKVLVGMYRRKIEPPKPLVWSWGSPDRIGLWAFAGDKEKPREGFSVSIAQSIGNFQLSTGWWCYLGLIPTIELPPKQYREPELPKDAGKQCEFANEEAFNAPTNGILLGCVKSTKDSPVMWRCNGVGYYQFARIEVSE